MHQVKRFEDEPGRRSAAKLLTAMRHGGLRQQQIAPLKQKRPNFVQPLKRN